CLSYPMTFDHALDIEWEPLFTQQLYAVVDREHPLATRGLVGFDELAVDDDDLVRPIAIGWMANRFLPPSAASFRDSALAWRRTRRARHDTAQPVQRARGSNARRKQR